MLSKKIRKILKLTVINFQYQTKEFFHNSTLHGVRYIVESGRSFYEKLVWFCFVTIGAVAAFVTIGSLWEKFQTSPTITGPDTEFHYEVLDYPTVVVCPESPINPFLTENNFYNQNLQQYEEFIPIFEMLPALSFDNINEFHKIYENITSKVEDEKMKKFSSFVKTIGLRQLIFNIAMKCEQLFVDEDDMVCEYLGMEYRCCDIFKPVYTERGFCYAFNSKYISEVDKEVKNEDIKTFTKAAFDRTLRFIPKHESKVYIFSPKEVLSFETSEQLTWYKNYSIAMTTEIKETYTEQDVKLLSVNQRKCTFDDEIALLYHQNDIFSPSVCTKKCRMLKANKLCKCIPPFYKPSDNIYQPCKLEKDIECLQRNSNNISNIYDCRDCLLNCNNVIFESIKIGWSFNTADKIKNRQGYVQVEVLSWPVVRYKHEVLFGLVDLLVSFGGIAGLFLGFSLLSLVEIVYYFTLRVICMFIINKEKLHELHKEKVSRPKPKIDFSLKVRRRKISSNIQKLKPVDYLNVPDVVKTKSSDSLVKTMKRKINRFDVPNRFQMDTKRGGGIKTSLKYQTKEFFNNSTLHGVRYIAEKGRSLGEKFMWFSFVSIGAVAAFVIIGSLWEKFQTNPTITGLDTDFHNQQVIFPTVTICPMASHDSEAVNETASEIIDADDETFGEFIPVLEALPRLTFDTFAKTYEAVFNMSDEVDLTKISLRQLAFKVPVKCEDLLEICKYKDEEISCCEYFLPIYSEHGFCYSFNTRYYGTSMEEAKNEKINDLFETDKKWSLTFVPSRAVKVFVHSVDEVTGYDFRPLFTWTDGHAIDLLITLKQTYTTDDARQLSVEQRKCIFPDEMKLKYYREGIYSFSTCMRDCRLKKTNKLCKCIPPFYMPSSESYRQCGLEDFICLMKYRGNITDIRSCRHCALSCLNTVYDIEKFSRTVVPETNKREDFRVNVEFLTWPIIRYKREVLFGWVDLLVSFGGIAGLFLGFSLLSGVEIAYYFTMRAGCMIYRNRDELYAAQEEEKSRSKAQYDLGLAPKLRDSNHRRSLSMSDVHTVRPVESPGSTKAIQVKAFDSPKVPIKNITVGKISVITKADELIISNQLQRFDVRNNGRKKTFIIPVRQDLFRPIQVSPYSQRIKPLDKKFHSRSQSEGPEIMYEGYLP
ncbi:CLUMA_CG004432, isoform A [Clunio marinus]|uniref:CLUMA_CG004432, isoform A n=1 Tax=Clunio marinus TaxID=568069 RepID=A0A1J1HTN2_9DIPT|nr:CLUMA_CG004432, isoform A [Clunio marinus]